MLEEIMRVEKADITDSDHGYAVIEIALTGNSSGQSCMLSIDPETAYNLLRLFQVSNLSEARGKPITVLRNEPYGLIQGLKSLPCDSPIEVMRQ